MNLISIVSILVAVRVLLALADHGLTGLYVCDGPDWSGECGYGAVVVGRCWDYQPGLNEIVSFGPDLDVTCTIYDQSACRGDALQVQWPGISDVSTFGA